MYDVASVRVIEGLADLADNVDGALRGHGAGPQVGVGVGAVDELHGNPQLPVVGLTAAVDRHDVGVRERGGHVCFPQKTGPELGVGAVRRGQHLQSVQPGQVRAVCEVHGAHTAGSEHPLDAVAG